jgi:hypothetical protein
MAQTALADPPKGNVCEPRHDPPSLHNYAAMTGGGTTIDIGEWLRGLGLGQYEATFRENEIDESAF